MQQKNRSKQEETNKRRLCLDFGNMCFYWFGLGGLPFLFLILFLILFFLEREGEGREDWRLG